MSKRRQVDGATDISPSPKRARVVDDHCHLLDAVTDVRAVISGFLPLADRIRLAQTCTTLKMERAHDLQLGTSLGVPNTVGTRRAELMAVADILSRCLVATELGDVRSYLKVHWHCLADTRLRVSIWNIGRRTTVEWAIYDGLYDIWTMEFSGCDLYMPHRCYLVERIVMPTGWTAMQSFVEAIKYLYLPRTDILPLETMGPVVKKGFL